MGSTHFRTCEMSARISSFHFTTKVPGTVNPTTQWKKFEISKWLLDNGVPYMEIRDIKKPELQHRARSLKVPVRLQVEEAIRGTGHTVIWLPPYHAALYLQCHWNGDDVFCQCYHPYSFKRNAFTYVWTVHGFILDLGPGEEILCGQHRLVRGSNVLARSNTAPKIKYSWN